MLLSVHSWHFKYYVNKQNYQHHVFCRYHVDIQCFGSTKCSWMNRLRAPLSPGKLCIIIIMCRNQGKNQPGFCAYATSISYICRLANSLKQKCRHFDENFRYRLHQKLSKWQLSVQPVMKISSNWHFRFSAGRNHEHKYRMLHAQIEPYQHPFFTQIIQERNRPNQSPAFS